MPFLGLFRSKDENLADALADYTPRCLERHSHPTSHWKLLLGINGLRGSNHQLIMRFVTNSIASTLTFWIIIPLVGLAKRDETSSWTYSFQ